MMTNAPLPVIDPLLSGHKGSQERITAITTTTDVSLNYLSVNNHRWNTNVPVVNVSEAVCFFFLSRLRCTSNGKEKISLLNKKRRHSCKSFFRPS